MVSVQIWLYALGAALLVSIISLIGLFLISRNGTVVRRKLVFIISLAVGALLGNAFLHLLPEAFESTLAPNDVALFALGGIFFFFLLDKFLHWHCHHGSCHVTPMGYKALIADGVHNILDGMVIGTAFLVSIDIGIATVVAVVLHEVPQELADFGILINAGFSKARALLLNFYSALAAIAGAIVALLLGTSVERFSPAMLAITAGMFIYLAAVDLIPDLHHGKTSTRVSFVQIIGIAVGIGAMLYLG